MKLNRPKRKLGFEIPESVPCSDFDPEDLKHKYEETGCFGCRYSHEFYWKDDESSMFSSYSRVSGPDCQFGKLTAGEYGKSVEIGDEEPYPTAIVTLRQVDKIESWLCYRTISKKVNFKNMGEIMYRIADVPQVAVISQRFGVDKEVPLKELEALRDKVLKGDEDFKKFESLGGHDLNRDGFKKLRKKGKTIEEIADMFK